MNKYDASEYAAGFMRGLEHARRTASDGFDQAQRLLADLAAARQRIAELEAENARLKAGGCARDQGATQFCAETVALQAEVARLRKAAGDLWCEIAPCQQPGIEWLDAQISPGALDDFEAAFGLGALPNA